MRHLKWDCSVIWLTRYPVKVLMRVRVSSVPHMKNDYVKIEKLMSENNITIGDLPFLFPPEVDLEKVIKMIIESKKGLKRCFECKTSMIPDKTAVTFGTKKWDGHTWKYNCNCNKKDLRLSIG